MTQATAYSEKYEKYLTNDVHDPDMILSNSSWTINSDQESKRWISISILDILEHLAAMLERTNSKCNSKIIFLLRSKSK